MLIINGISDVGIKIYYIHKSYPHYYNLAK